MNQRYQVIEGSQSSHCCFDYTVVDTTQPDMIGDKHYNDQYIAICECFGEEDAKAIADAMNAKAAS